MRINELHQSSYTNFLTDPALRDENRTKEPEMVNAIAAKFEITELISRYGNYLDDGDFDSLEALFEPDASLRIRPGNGVPDLTGRHNIRNAIEERWSLVHMAAQRRHVMSNIVVEPTGDSEATARTVLMVCEVSRARGSDVSVHGMGVYDDLVVRSSAGWRFGERCLSLDRVDYFASGWHSTD